MATYYVLSDNDPLDKENLDFSDYYEKYGDSQFEGEQPLYQRYDPNSFSAAYRPFIKQLNKIFTYNDWIYCGVSEKASNADWDDLYHMTIADFGIYWVQNLNRFNRIFDLDKLKAFLDAFGDSQIPKAVEAAVDFDDEYVKDADMVESHLKAYITKYGIDKFLNLIETKNIEAFYEWIAYRFKLIDAGEDDYEVD